jgi:chromosome segregation ATPase
MASRPLGSGQPRASRGRKDPNVIKRVSFPGQQTPDEARAKVTDLQRQIEAKEAELLRMKEALARNDTTCTSAAQIELNRLQAAFDQVSKLSDAKLQPVVANVQKTQARLESRKFRMKMFHRAAKERDRSLKYMQQRIDQITADLESPEVPESDESAILALILENQKAQNEFQCTHRTKQLRTYTEKTFGHINEILTKQLNELRDLETRAIRRAESVRQETEIRVNRPTLVIDDDWVLARHTMDKLRIMLEDAKRSVKFLNDTAEQLANSNRRVHDELGVTKDELARLRKFMPNATHVDPSKKNDGVSRGDLTSIEIHRDAGEMVLVVARIKTQALKSSLETLRTKVNEMPEAERESEEQLEQAKIERENAEKAYDQAVELRAELLARKLFAEQETQLLSERVDKQMATLEKIKRDTQEAHETLEKQKMAMRLNEELQNLKTMNFDRFAATVANVMALKNRM